MEAARDVLAVEMFALVKKEAQLAHNFLQYLKLQRAYHESALHFLHDTVPELERFISKYNESLQTMSCLKKPFPRLDLFQSKDKHGKK